MPARHTLGEEYPRTNFFRGGPNFLNKFGPGTKIFSEKNSLLDHIFPDHFSIDRTFSFMYEDSSWK